MIQLSPTIFLIGALMMNLDNYIFSEKNIEKNAHDFCFTSINGKDKISLLDFRGKVILVVNTASKCGFTSQYADLEKLYRTYKDKGLIIIGVPSNDFGAQEQGTNEEIATFCQLNYDLTFLMAQKEKILGKDAHPFYRWVKEKLGFGKSPKWNFYKYLINRHGELIDYFNSTTYPQSDRFKRAVKEALNETISKVKE